MYINQDLNGKDERTFITISRVWFGNQPNNQNNGYYLTKIFPSVKRAGLRARKLDAPLLINLSIYEKLREKLRIILSKRQVRKQSEVRDN